MSLSASGTTRRPAGSTRSPAIQPNVPNVNENGGLRLAACGLGRTGAEQQEPNERERARERGKVRDRK